VDDDLIYLIGGYLALRALADYQDKIVPAIEQKGAELFETVHPDQAAHANDLPGKAMTRAQIRAYVDHFAFAQPDVAVAIALAESGGVPNALGDIRDGVPISVGLWQINTRAWPQWTRGELKDPKRNAEAAFAISKGGTDWHDWSTWWKDPVHKIGPGQGAYLRFMPGGSK
jgi:hypothetical protein